MNRRCISAIKICTYIIDRFLLLILIMLLGCALYFIIDSRLEEEYSFPEIYEEYRPDEEEAISFTELQQINKDVVGWLLIDGTGIDYPIVHCDNNCKYLTVNALGEKSSGGALFIDCANSGDMSDFNTIIYGHHMANGCMFGNLDKYNDEEYFDIHRSGELYVSGKKYKLNFFAFISEANGYDSNLYSPGLESARERDVYYEYIKTMARHYKPVEINKTSKIVLLSTCNNNITNGRSLLIGKLESPDSKDTLFIDSKSEYTNRYFMIALYAMTTFLTLALIAVIYASRHKKRRK